MAMSYIWKGLTEEIFINATVANICFSGHDTVKILPTQLHPTVANKVHNRVPYKVVTNLSPTNYL